MTNEKKIHMATKTCIVKNIKEEFLLILIVSVKDGFCFLNHVSHYDCRCFEMTETIVKSRKV